MFILSGCEEFERMKTDIKEGFKNAKLKGYEDNPMKELESEEIAQVEPNRVSIQKLKIECKDKIRYHLGILNKKYAYDFDLIEYKIFSDINEAKEYSILWDVMTPGGERSKERALEDLRNAGTEEVFIGVIRVDYGTIGFSFSDGGFGKYVVTAPIVCIDGEIMPESKVFFK